MRMKRNVQPGSGMRRYLSLLSFSAKPHDNRPVSSPEFPLPQEIVDAIVDQLEDDQASLAVAGLISRHWYQPTRERLFRHIKLGDRQPQSRCRLLLQLMQQGPSLASYMKELTLVEDPSVYSHSAHESWLQLSSYTVKLLPLLSSVTHLRIMCHYRLNWSILPTTLQAELYDMMARPSTTRLSLSKVHEIDFTRIAQCRNLEHLSLNRVSGPPHSPTGVDVNKFSTLTPELTGNQGLRFLRVEECEDAIQALLAYARHSRTAFRPAVLEVGTGASEAMASALTSLFSFCGRSIESYTIRQPFHDRLSPFVFEFGQLPRLTTFTVSLHAESFPHSCAVLLDQLSHLAESGGTWPFSFFILELNIERRSVGRDISRVVDYQAKANSQVWERLDSILSSPAFPNLAQVAVSFGVVNSTVSKLAWTTAQGRVIRKMPALSRRGLLVLRISRRPPAS
ncbi:hypothetical protein D9611_007523 [Ephemerocybe angulata]|uniref:F-box domain-containing protein n=1 Tax=Ephemerocybe angulata TaxID=980116 RepID=A0A8H5FL40_9AGAR|nr:hypothetical protein D9611_007523 [Tulosesus angulatus]